MASSNAALSAEDLIAWSEASASIWRELAAAEPAVLNVPCDIYKAQTIGQLLQHIAAAELRYAERLSDASVTDYSKITFATSEEIFATHDLAIALFRHLLADVGYNWSDQIEFATLTAGKRRAARSAVFHHAMLHGIRHYAQLATLARKHGFKSGPADYLVTNSTLVI